ncbi:carboxypeptidase-like regulatory domain-containing protein [Natronorubrum thiooxidans]|uniref:Carboxypeptidase regulatory-like domain-containing protein n=1 Tax=Natronorubrum thiooxidans TaxID=308853 RepID=A0A1N7E8X2_9EURY|nr:carboxypeptidase-like regulatory domain-containing protein [Natronorubrum thiooxidans]SIR84500.1 hypothetical protein SAMN05421752_103308 [Natronorubrum thiooxidans]
MRVKRSLVLECSRHEVLVGRPFVVRVRDTRNRPVEGATVEAGSKRTRTDERGRCEFTFHTPGFWKLVASKSPTDRDAYIPDATLVRALPRSTTTRTARRLHS